MKLASYTFKIEEVRTMVWNALYGPITDISDPSGYGEAVVYAAQKAFNSNVSDLIAIWCEVCSDYWFDQNPGISDALVLLINGEKLWMASDLTVDEIRAVQK